MYFLRKNFALFTIALIPFLFPVIFYNTNDYHYKECISKYQHTECLWGKIQENMTIDNYNQISLIFEKISVFDKQNNLNRTYRLFDRIDDKLNPIEIYFNNTCVQCYWNGNDLPLSHLPCYHISTYIFNTLSKYYLPLILFVGIFYYLYINDHLIIKPGGKRKKRE